MIWPLTRLGVLIAISSIPLTGLADRLVTKTGETLQGTVVKETPEGVVFESRAFGQLTVPRDSIFSLELEPEPASARQATPAAAAAAPKEPAARDSGEVAESGPNRVGRFLARINPLKGWKSSFQLGFTARRGEDNDNNFDARFRSERKSEDNEHLIESRFLYAEDVLQNDVRTKTDELLTASYQFRHDLAAPYFLQSNSAYYRDVIKELNHEVTQTAGAGIRVKWDKLKASIAPAAGVRYRDIAADKEWLFVVGAYQDLEANITTALKLRESLYYLVAPDRTDDYSTRLAIELNQSLSSVWALGLRYDYTYDAVVGKDASRYQQRWSLTLGLDF